VPGPFFEVTSVTGPASVGSGAPATVTAEITNTGEEPGQRAISFALGDERRDRFVELNAGESRTLAFTVPAPSDQGTYDAAVRTGDDTETTDVEVTGQQFVCGQSTGDPHITTFDGLSYDYMTAEDTVILDGETTDGHRLLVTARQAPVDGSDSVTVNNATATAVGDDVVILRAGAEQPLSINGDPVPLASGDAVSVGNGGEVRKQGSTYTVFYPGPDDEATADDEHLTAHVVGDRIDIEACLQADRDAPVQGLLGTVDDSPDVTFRNGTALDRPLDTDVLYGAFSADWAATGDENLFSTRYEVEGVPRNEVTVDDLSAEQRARAEDALADTCLEPRTPQYRDALIDVALTGDTSYVASACRVNRESVTEGTDANFQPTASFSGSAAAPEVGETVTFTAANSTDGDGSIVSYRWDLDGDGAFDDATGVEVTTSYDTPGEVAVRLRVEDDDGARETAETSVTVLAGPNTAPSPSFSVDPAEPVVGETVTFDATDSTDPDGSIVSYRWDLDGDGAFDDATGATVTVSYSTAQEVTIALQVEDDAGATNTTEMTVVVSEDSNVIAPGQPGFGVGLAAVALIVVVLLARRRN
jgi:PGF-CTERM protein